MSSMQRVDYLITKFCTELSFYGSHTHTLFGHKRKNSQIILVVVDPIYLHEKLVDNSQFIVQTFLSDLGKWKALISHKKRAENIHNNPTWFWIPWCPYQRFCKLFIFFSYNLCIPNKQTSPVTAVAASRVGKGSRWPSFKRGWRMEVKTFTTDMIICCRGLPGVSPWVVIHMPEIHAGATDDKPVN